jgi:hypothetical protein
MLSIVIIMFISDRKSLNIIIIIIVSMGRQSFYNSHTHQPNACPILINTLKTFILKNSVYYFIFERTSKIQSYIRNNLSSNWNLIEEQTKKGGMISSVINEQKVVRVIREFSKIRPKL